MVKMITDTEWVNKDDANFDLYTLYKNNTQLMNSIDYKFICKTVQTLLQSVPKEHIASVTDGVVLVNHDTYSVYLDTHINHNFPIYLNKLDLKIITKAFSNIDLFTFKSYGDSCDIKAYQSKEKNLICYKEKGQSHKTTLVEEPTTKRITIPKKAEIVASVNISEKISNLIQAKKAIKAKYYNIHIDKKTNKIISIGVEKQEVTFIENFIDIKKFTQSDDCIVIKTVELAPLHYKRSMDIVLNLHQYNSNFYIETISNFEQNNKNYSCYLNAKVNLESCKEENKNIIDLNRDPIKPKTLSNRWGISTRLNKFKFTIHTKDQDFLNKLQSAFNHLGIISININSKIKEYDYGLQSLSQEHSSIVKIYLNNAFLKLKISNKFDYTFTFMDLNSYENKIPPIDKDEILPIPKNSIPPINKEEAQTVYETRFKAISLFMKLIKNQNLYDDTKIKSIGFANIFYDKKQFDKTKLLKLNTTPSSTPYKCYDYKDNETIYTSMNYYKAYLKDYKKIVEDYQTKNKKHPLSKIDFKNLKDDQLIDILRQSIQKKFKHSIKIEVIQEQPKLFYAKAISDGTLNINTANFKKKFDLISEAVDEKTNKIIYTVKINNIEEYIYRFYKRKKLNFVSYTITIDDINFDQSKVKYILETELKNKLSITQDIKVFIDNHGNYCAELISNGIIKINKPIKINQDIELDFKLSSDIKSSYFKVSASLKAYEFQLSQLKYEYEINRWDTRNSNLLQGNNSKYYFTLSSNINHILENISSFTKRYKLICTEKLDLLENISNINFKSIKKLEAEICKSGNTIDLLKQEANNRFQILSKII